MVRYHGTPITPADACEAALRGRHGMVSYQRPDQVRQVAEVSRGFVLDNGAFTAWRAGRGVRDWSGYYAWAEHWLAHPGCDWAVIPDVIDGSEAENDGLVAAWPFGQRGVPVWHLHEGLGRLRALAAAWPRVAVGSSGQYRRIGSVGWWRRMREAMGVLCGADGAPRVAVHGLRMMGRRVMAAFPFASVDSCRVGRAVGLDRRWRGELAGATPADRARHLAGELDRYAGAVRWRGAGQLVLFADEWD